MAVKERNILDLKAEGKSLRQIAVALGISHEAVRKRLKNLESKDRMSTKARAQKLTVSTRVKERASSGSNARKSKAGEEYEVVVNRVSTEKTPPLTISQGVNPLKTTSKKPTEGMSGVLSEVDDLFGAIKEFLESKGIEVYRRDPVPECFQVKHNGQTIRFYVQKNVERPRSPWTG